MTHEKAGQNKRDIDSISCVVYQILKGNPRAIEIVEGWLYVRDRLPPRQQIVLDLWMNNLKVGEIAKILDIKRSTAKKYLNQATRKIIKIMI